MRKARRGEAALLTRQLDNAARDLAKARRPYCEWCMWELGEEAARGHNLLHWHHIIRRTRFCLRWNDRNIVVLCYAHHLHGAHGDWIASGEYRSFIEEARPEDVAFVEAHAEDDGHMTIPEKRDLLAKIKSELSEVAA